MHDRRAARGVGGGAAATPPRAGVLPHALGRDVVAAHREAGRDQVLGEGRAQQAHADERNHLRHGRAPSEPGVVRGAAGLTASRAWPAAVARSPEHAPGSPWRASCRTACRRSARPRRPSRRGAALALRRVRRGGLLAVRRGDARGRLLALGHGRRSSGSGCAAGMGCAGRPTSARRARAPELARGQGGALGQRFELGPRDLRMDAAAEAAVGGGDDPLPADRAREARDALRHQLRMLDDVGGVAHDARQDDLVLGQHDVVPHLPLVLVADIGGLERVGAALDGQHHVDDVAHRDVGRVGPVPASPAEVKADAVLGQAADGVVERLDADHREPPVVLDGGLRIHHVPVLGDGRIVELEDEPRVDDGPVLLAHGVGAGEEEFLVRPVVAVGDAGGAAGGDGGHEALLDAGGGEGRLQVLDVGPDRLVPGIGEGTDADGPARRAGSGRDAGLGIRVRGREAQAIAAIAEAGEHDIAGARPGRRHVVEPLRARARGRRGAGTSSSTRPGS